MASRAAGTLLTGNNACYVPPSLMPGYQGHIPNVSFSFGDTYGNTTLKYFQDNRNAAMDTSYSPYSKGGQFPTLYSRNPNLALGYRAHAWDRWLHTPTYTRFNLDCHRSEELRKFYQLVQMHREYYQDKTGTVNRVPYFVLPMEEKDHYPLPTDQPPLKTMWHLVTTTPEDPKACQLFPPSKKVPPQLKGKDRYFESRA